MESFAAPSVFLETHDAATPGCLVLDVRLPEMSGLELQERLRASGSRIPVVMITAYGDAPTAIRAIKGGAVDILEKPINDQVLLDAIQHCIDLDLDRRRIEAAHAGIRARYETLSRRERQVMALLVAGQSNEAIAGLLGISRKTVEVHRARVMEKMTARSIVFLVHMAAICGLREDLLIGEDPVIADLPSLRR